MSRLRLILLASLAAVVVSAIGSASASALVKCDPVSGGDLTWCIETSPGVKAEVGASGTIAEETISSKGGASSITAAIMVECKKETDSGTILQETDSLNPQNSDIEIVFMECSVKGNSKCVVHSPGQANGTIVVGPEIDSEVVEIGGKIYDKFFDSEGKGKFVTLEVGNKGTENCLVKGNYEVTGEACGQASTASLAIVQTLTFSKAVEEACKTELKLKGVKAVFTDKKELELSGPNKGKPWGIAES